MGEKRTQPSHSIILVDDERDVASVLQRGLEREGFKVCAFDDSEEALSHFTPGSYDFLITDVSMPKLNGFELYSKIARQDPKIKVCFLTGYEIFDRSFRMAHPNSNLAFVMHKPVSLTALSNRIRSELGERSMR